MILHHREIKNWPYKRFPSHELACLCCGQLRIDDAVIRSIDVLNHARQDAARPFYINSAYRCPIHNAHIGGAPLSQHKIIAFDISLRNHDRFQLLGYLRQAGMGSFGLYRTFIHTDIRPGRTWYGKGAKELWNG